MAKNYWQFTELLGDQMCFGVEREETVPFQPPMRGFKIVAVDVVVVCPTREARDAAWRLLTGEGL